MKKLEYNKLSIDIKKSIIKLGGKNHTIFSRVWGAHETNQAD
jgi:hypothetical protein